MVRQFFQAVTLSLDGFQIFWPQMTYLTLLAEAWFMTHSAMSSPDRVACYKFQLHQLARRPRKESRVRLTLPPSEIIKSIALPQQCSESPGQAQSLLHPISLTLPGNWPTTVLAPSTATFWHAPTGGTIEASAYPPKTLPALLQHFIWPGPGHRLDAEVPPQSEVQLHAEASPLHFVLVQQRMLSPSAGQAPVVVVPPDAVQSDLAMQTPPRPEGP